MKKDKEEEEYGTKCPHHGYVVISARETERRLQGVEKTVAELSTLVTTVCTTVNNLTLAINAMVDASKKANDETEKTLKSISVEVGKIAVKTEGNEKNINMVRDWVIGAFSSAFLISIGWIIWWLQNNYLATKKVAWLLCLMHN